METALAPEVGAVLAFWFEELSPEQWFAKDPLLDATIRHRFGELYEALAADGPGDWEETAEGALAAVIVLDQFPRNIFRDRPRAFASDGQALGVAERAIARGLDAELAPARRAFLYMPFQHSEDPGVQSRSVALFEDLGNPRTLDFARRHRAIIDRFGRFPHRNAILGRETTAEEAAFLQEPGSAF
jgi:uncharacterized protein (DUF924 family)